MCCSKSIETGYILSKLRDGALSHEYSVDDVDGVLRLLAQRRMRNCLPSPLVAILRVH